MGKTTRTTNKSEPWAPAQPYLETALGAGQGLYDSGGFAPDPYQGQRVAGFGGTTLGAQQGILGQAAGGAPGIDAARTSLMGMMDGGQQYSDMAGVRRELLGSAIPAAGAMFSGSGMLNSSTAMDEVGRSATQALAPFEYGAYENQQNRALSAAGMMPGIEQAGYLPYQMQMGVGQQQDAMSQLQADAQMRQYYETANQPAQNYQGYLQAMMGLGGMGGTQTGTEKKPFDINSALGTAGTLASALPMLMALSDRRLKEDIERIGHLDNGTPIYRFRYIGEDRVQIGVMADEVPHAVAGHIAGYAYVDYGRI